MWVTKRNDSKQSLVYKKCYQEKGFCFRKQENMHSPLIKLNKITRHATGWAGHSLVLHVEALYCIRIRIPK